jgi:predicted aconitase with swiveling domain
VIIQGTTLAQGTGEGAALTLSEPLSFWGGTDREGLIVDTHHPQFGTSLVGRVVVMAGRGSSSSSSVLAEQIRAGAAPAAIVLLKPDAIVVLGSLVARELYDIRLPIVVVEPHLAAQLVDGVTVSVNATSDAATITW